MEELGISAGMYIFIVISAIIISAFYIFCYWRIFEKAGKPGWACLIPIYREIVLLEIVRKPWWWLFLMMFPIPIWSIWVINLLSKSFGKGVGFTLGLLFFGYIFLPILAFGDAQYQYGTNDLNDDSLDAGVV
ncbi:hypothetical protein KFE98_04530 [bacterium SCSIO 12741]|nr:hypothetical protein KFE98_04530 [bacterium SCSIO 12741]